jgi:formate dehydrogenase accessory protein FdhE
MTAKNVAGEYDRRIRRAEHLVSVHPFAQEILTFYIRVAEFQKGLYARVLAAPRGDAKETSSLLKDAEIQALLPQFKEFVELVAEHGPVTLAEFARQLAAASPGSWSDTLSGYWNAGGHELRANAAFEQFLPRAFLQPYAEQLVGDVAGRQIAGSPTLCPVCGARPLLGVLRPEGDGGKRFLMCSFCLREWEFRRIFCATCGEETENKLPVYVAEQFPQMRVEGCETCKFYLRTIDMTKDGNAVPLVDDLAAIPLSLWAEEHGYSRAQPNLLGT